MQRHASSRGMRIQVALLYSRFTRQQQIEFARSRLSIKRRTIGTPRSGDNKCSQEAQESGSP